MIPRFYFYSLIILSALALSKRTLLSHSHLTFPEITYYVNQNSPSASPNGSLDNPFTSLENALTSIADIEFEVRLLGTDVTITTELTIPTGSSCTIRFVHFVFINHNINRPDSVDSTKPLFQLKLATGSSVSVTDTALTLEDLQIVELDNDRPSDSYAFNVVMSQFALNVRTRSPGLP